MSDSIRSVQRALRLIRLMNTRPVWTLAELVRELQLPKTSVFRMLRTLEEEGFVQSPPGTHGLYRICSSVQDLASGITSESVLADIAAPIVIAGTKRLRWPLSVAVLDDCHMRVIFCGMPYSRLATRTTTVNRRYWMFTSALGRAYFASCHPIERQVITERAIEFLNEHGLDWPYTAAELAAEMKATRDILEHNAGVVNDIYIRKAGNRTRYAVGDLVEIDDSYHFASWRLIKKVAADLTAAAIAKFATP